MFLTLNDLLIDCKNILINLPPLPVFFDISFITKCYYLPRDWHAK